MVLFGHFENTMESFEHLYAYKQLYDSFSLGELVLHRRSLLFHFINSKTSY